MPKKKPTKKYTVTLSRTIEHTARVEDVEASSVEEAVKKATAIADNPHPHNRAWVEGDVVEESALAREQS